MIAGCQSAGPGLSEFPETEGEIALVELSADDKIFAEVLARYAQGLIHEYQREYESALENYLLAVELDPDNEELNFRIAMGFLRQKRTKEAIRIIEAVLERDPKSTHALSVLAMSYRIAGQPDQARETYDRLLQIDESDPLPYLDYAAFYILQGDMDAARRILETGIRNVKKPLDLYLNLSRIYIDDSVRATTNEDAFAFREKAIGYLEQALKLESKNRELLFRVGDLHILNDQHDKAMKVFRTIEKEFPDDLQTKQELALRFVATGDIDEAIATLESISKDQPSNPQVYYYLGELYLENENPDKAIENFRLSATATKNDPLPYIRLAMLLRESDAEKAIDVLFDGLEKMSGNGLLSEELAYTYSVAGRYELAFEWFAKARKRLREEQTSSRFHYHYARAAYETGDLEEALTSLTHAGDANHIYLYFFLQESLTNAELSQLIGFFESYVEKKPADAAARISLGTLHSVKEDFAAAIANFEKALELAGTGEEADPVLDGEFYFSFAAAHERIGNIGTAEKFFLKAVELDPSNVKARNYLAYMWAEHNIHLERALEQVRIALDSDPASGAYVDTLGWIYYQQEKYEEALLEITRASKLVPDDPIITDHLGDVLHKLEREEEAIEAWKRSFVLDPADAAVEEKLTSRDIDLTPLREEAEVLKAARETMGTGTEGEVPALDPDATMIAEKPDGEVKGAPAEDAGEINSMPEFEEPESPDLSPDKPVDSPDVSILEPVEAP
jgi:tetratricopeptide (TPR) repeat protein